MARWCQFHVLPVHSVDAACDAIARAVEDTSDVYFDSRRRAIELTQNGIVVPLDVSELALLEGAGYRAARAGADAGTPRVAARGYATARAQDAFDRTGCVRLRREHARAFCAAVDRRLLALVAFASLEVLAGRARRSACDAGWLACPVASSLTRFYSHTREPARCQYLVDVAEQLRAHGSAR